MRDDSENFYGAACPACKEQRDHTNAELRQHHPFATKDAWTDEEINEIAQRLERSCGTRKASTC